MNSHDIIFRLVKNGWSSEIQLHKMRWAIQCTWTTTTTKTQRPQSDILVLEPLDDKWLLNLRLLLIHFLCTLRPIFKMSPSGCICSTLFAIERPVLSPCQQVSPVLRYGGWKFSSNQIVGVSVERNWFPRKGYRGTTQIHIRPAILLSAWKFNGRSPSFLLLMLWRH